MPDHIRYDLLTQQALRGVVRNVLTEAAKKGLPGEHHFYISFDTQADGVRLSERLRAQYPGADDHRPAAPVLGSDGQRRRGFEVGLSFGGMPEKLGVPFDAIKGFFDPSVQFGLQFEEVAERGQPRRGTAEDAGKAGKKPRDARPGRAAAEPPAPPAAPGRPSRRREARAGQARRRRRGRLASTASARSRLAAALPHRCAA